MAAAARVAAPSAGRAQRVLASRRRAVRHRRAADHGRAAGRARADARRAAAAGRGGGAPPGRRRSAARGGAARPRARRRRARRAAWAAAGPGCRHLARAHLGAHRRDHHRPGRDRENLGPGHRRQGLGRAGVRHRHLPERHQRTPRGRRPGRRQHHPAPRRPDREPDPARLAHPRRRRLHDLRDPPGRDRQLCGAEQLQAGPGRGPGTARRRGRRRRHDTARGPARLRPAGRTGPVHRRLGTRRLAAAAPRRRYRAG